MRILNIHKGIGCCIVLLAILMTSCIDYSQQGLFLAIKNNDIKTLEKITEKIGLDSCINQNGLNPLLYALKIGSDEAVSFIMPRMDDFSYQEPGGLNAVFATIISDCSDRDKILEILFKRGQDPNQLHPNRGSSAFNVAIEFGDSTLLKVFIDNGADINLIDESGLSPLYNAIGLGENKSAKFLFNKGANVNVQSIYGNSALEVASVNNNFEMFQFLLENSNILINKKIFESACGAKDSRYVKYLLDNKLVSKSVIKDYLFCVDNVEVMELLLKEVGDVNYIDKEYGITPLHFACIDGNEKIIKILIDQGADVNLVCKNKFYTPLMYASVCYNNNQQTSSNLSSLGIGYSNAAKIKLGMSETKTPATSLASVKLLVEAGANINYKNKNKYTAFKNCS